MTIGKGPGSAKKPTAGKPEEKEPEDRFEVWTPFGECGVSFQTGETYLVYASDDEETSDSITTDKYAPALEDCPRPARIWPISTFIRNIPRNRRE